VTSDTITTSVAEEAKNAFSAGDNRACSNRGSKENRYSDGILSIKGRGQLLCHRGKYGEELLCLWQI